jgi:acyl carrier protein
VVGAELLAAQVRELIRALLPPDAPNTIEATAELGERGLGLDSVAVVDLLCACEARFDIRLPAEVLLVEEDTEASITVAALTDEVARRIHGGHGSLGG